MNLGLEIGAQLTRLFFPTKIRFSNKIDFFQTIRITLNLLELKKEKKERKKKKEREKGRKERKEKKKGKKERRKKERKVIWRNSDCFKTLLADEKEEVTWGEN